MPNLDTQDFYTIHLDLIRKTENEQMYFNLSDSGTSDFYIKITKDGLLIDLTQCTVTMYVVKPNKNSEFINLEYNAEKQMYYCNLPDNFKNIRNKYKAQIAVYNPITKETKITRSNFTYQIESDVKSEIEGAVDQEEQENLLTELMSRLTSLEENGTTMVSALIDDSNTSTSKSYSSKKVEDIKKDIDSQIKDIEQEISSIVLILDNIDDIQSVYNLAVEGSTIKLKAGVYELNSKLIFDKKINIDFNDSVIKYIGDEVGTIIKIGNDTNRIEGINVSVNVEQVKNWSNDRVGIEVLNIKNSDIILSSTGFKTNILINATNECPNCYNKYNLKKIVEGLHQLKLTCDLGGWTNENIFFGGNFSWYTGTDTTNATCVNIDSTDYRLNNNKFYGCSFEDINNKATAININNGANNYFYDCRYEGAKKINLLEKSIYNVISHGWDLRTATITNTGEKNTIFDSEYLELESGSDGIFVGKQVGGVNKKVFVGKNTSGVETFAVKGSGDTSCRSIITNYGVRWNEDELQGIFRGTGSPEGKVTAKPGSLYINAYGGAGATLWVKESGNENTGWVAK